MLISENILSKSVLKPKLGYLPTITGLLRIPGPWGKVGTLCSAAEEYCSKRWDDRVPGPPCSYGVSASPKQRQLGRWTGPRDGNLGRPRALGSRLPLRLVGPSSPIPRRSVPEGAGKSIRCTGGDWGYSACSHRYLT